MSVSGAGCGWAQDGDPGCVQAGPVAVEVLRAAVARVPAARPVAVGLHLALPVDQVTGADAVRVGDELVWRGVRVPVGDDPVAAVAALVAAGHRDGDRYLALCPREPLHAWCKPLRSGFRGVVFGADLLLGGLMVAYECDLPDRQVRAALGELARRVPVAPALVEAAGAPVLVDGGEGSLVLRAAAAGPSVLAAPAAVGVGDWRGRVERWAPQVAAALGALGVEVVALGSRVPGTWDADLVCELEDGWEAVVPVTVGAGGILTGVAAEDCAKSVPLPLPAGFAWCGRALWEDAAVGEHASGVRAIVRPRRP